MRVRRALPVLGLLAACGGAPDPPGAPDVAPDGAPPPAAAERPAPGPWFADAGERWGLAFAHEAGFTEEKHLPETMGTGAALVDLEGDGDLDVYFVQGGPFPPGPDASAPPNRLYVADAPGAFSDATERSGDAAHRGYGMGVSAGDVDGDGDPDLFVTNFGPDVLLLQEEGLAFRDATGPELGDARWTAGSTLFDADRDGDLDLYVTAYVAVDLDDPEWCGRREPGWRSFCHPDHYPGLADRYYENDGRGGFRDATAAAGLTGNDGKGLGVVAADFEGDGDLDLYVANDSVENRYWTNLGDGRFEDGTLLTGTGVNGRGATEAGMGLAVGDVDGDLDLDLFVTNYDGESNTLYRNDGDGLFTDVTAAAGLDAPSRLPVGFGTVLEDLDGDGLLDLAVANGHIIDNIDLYHDGKSWAQEALLFAGEPDGTFRPVPERAGPLGEPAVGRGLYAGDLDGDGDADLVLTQCGGPARVLENLADGRRFWSLAGCPPDATVVLTTDDGRRVLRSTGQPTSYLGSGSPVPRVGLPRGGVVSVRIAGPAGVLELEADAPWPAGRYRLDTSGAAPAIVAR